MILVDTSVWIEHLRRGVPELHRRLDSAEVISHAFVIGELAMGALHPRHELLRDLARLPSAIPASHEEVMGLVERERLFGLGLGYIDAALLAATRLTPDAKLWSRDARLAAAATRLGVAA